MKEVLLLCKCRVAVGFDIKHKSLTITTVAVIRYFSLTLVSLCCVFFCESVSRHILIISSFVASYTNDVD